jgi:hypothetical protein
MSDGMQTILDATCELVFDAVDTKNSEYMVTFDAEWDSSTRLEHYSVVISTTLFPSQLRDAITRDVERRVTGFFADLDVVVKATDDTQWGRCFVIHLPPELRGFSWDKVNGCRKFSLV